MRIRYISASGAGVVETREIPDGTTVTQFFSMIHGENASIGNYVVQVDGEQPEANQVLQEGQEVILSPAKVQGA